jgi:hypothetical protein
VTSFGGARKIRLPPITRHSAITITPSFVPPVRSLMKDPG